ncbi:MAG TPA: enoyl-CoA hydratase/isomerase family protein [Micrococcaceae bacterium]|jgi:enoyl-CoA hydratase/carnithine racemase
MTVEDSVQVGTVSVGIDGAVAVVSFGSGERYNALGTPDWRQLHSVVALLADRGDLRAVVLRGRGGAFCSGSDLREWSTAEGADVADSFAVLERALQAIEDLPVPTVAVVEGVATGAGFQLALACDLQLVARSARLGMPIARLGLMVPATFANRMALRIGPARTKDLLYGGRLLDGAQAYGIGLVSTLVEDGGTDAALAGLLASWMEGSAASLRASKAAVGQGLRPVSDAGRRAPAGPGADPQEFESRLHRFLNRHHPPRS